MQTICDVCKKRLGEVNGRLMNCYLNGVKMMLCYDCRVENHMILTYRRKNVI